MNFQEVGREIPNSYRLTISPRVLQGLPRPSKVRQGKATSQPSKLITSASLDAILLVRSQSARKRMTNHIRGAPPEITPEAVFQRLLRAPTIPYLPRGVIYFENSSNNTKNSGDILLIMEFFNEVFNVYYI